MYITATAMLLYLAFEVGIRVKSRTRRSGAVVSTAF
jgi:hypothetical protein